MSKRRDIWEREAVFYKAAGFQPLDEYIEKVLQTDPKATRRLGATTWMTCRAALALEEGKSVLIVQRYGGQVSQKRELLKTTWAWLDYSKVTQKVGTLEVLTEASQGRRYDQVFDEEAWDERIIRRASSGPAEMIRGIKVIDSKLMACAEDDEVLFQLTPEGASEILKRFPNPSVSEAIRVAELKEREQLDALWDVQQAAEEALRVIRGPLDLSGELGVAKRLPDPDEKLPF